MERAKANILSLPTFYTCIKELCGDKVIYTEELIKNSDVSLPDFKYFENFWPTPMEQPQIVDNLQGSEISILSGPSDVRNIRSVR